MRKVRLFVLQFILLGILRNTDLLLQILGVLSQLKLVFALPADSLGNVTDNYWPLTRRAQQLHLLGVHPYNEQPCPARSQAEIQRSSNKAGCHVLQLAQTLLHKQSGLLHLNVLDDNLG